MEQSSSPPGTSEAQLPAAKPGRRDQSGIDPVLERNIAALLEQKKRDEAKRKTEERVADAISRFTGSMKFVYLHLVVFGTWIVVNLKYTPFPKFDPTFVVLAMVASVEAIFLSTFILITQNRMGAAADRRAELDVQIGLLAEAEITKLVQLVAEIAERMNVPQADHPEVEDMKRMVAPEAVLDAIDESLEDESD